MIWRRCLLSAGMILVLCASTLSCRRQNQSESLKPLPPQAKPTVESVDVPVGAISGHQATVRCLRGERAMTDGDELRCEDWSYVHQNYR